MTWNFFKGAFVALIIAAANVSPMVASTANAMGCGCCGGQKAAGKTKSGCMAGGDAKGGMSCMKGMDMGSMDNMSMAQKDSDDAMMSGMDHSKMDMSSADPAPSNASADVAFAKAMIPHHEAAIEMAQQLLKNGKNDEMKSMASEIIAAQNKEIKLIYGWLAKNAE